MVRACFRKSPSRLVAGVAAKIGIELRNEYQPQKRSPRRKIPAGADPAGEDAGLPPVPIGNSVLFEKMAFNRC